jgi:DNA-directed RNA polymerase specialized sigma24 family protein
MRRTHLAFSLARHLRRSAFRWAVRESRLVPAQVQNETTPEESAPPVSDEPPHSAILLEQFLDVCERRGWLSSSDRRLLTQAKIEGISYEELSRRNGHSAFAIQHRIQRAIDRLRRLTRNPKPAPPVQLELFPR